VRGLLLPLVCAALVAHGSARQGATFDRVLALKPQEGVFAYARISPDGRYLAYASEMPSATRPSGITQTVTVVDLTTKATLFTEPGIDAYWSVNGRQMIFLSFLEPQSRVAIRDHQSGAVTRDVAPVPLGDYFSWAVRDGRDLILTIRSNYYYLENSRGVMPPASVPSCEGIGMGDRPLISKDGRRITTFVRGEVVVRGLDDCRDVIHTGFQGAKADFSFDGRYVAFHAPKAGGSGYDIQVVDLVERTVRTVTSFRGSSLFPSWTADGRLCFRYDGDDYRGFMMARDVLSAAARPLPAAGARVPDRPTWTEIFPETPRPSHELNLVLIWAAWSAHSPIALVDLQRARDTFARESADVGVFTATDLASARADVDGMRRRYRVDLPEIPLATPRLALTEAINQIPTTLLFRHGVLVDRRLGAQSYDDLRAWIAQAASFSAPDPLRRR